MIQIHKPPAHRRNAQITKLNWDESKLALRRVKYSIGDPVSKVMKLSTLISSYLRGNLLLISQWSDFMEMNGYFGYHVLIFLYYAPHYFHYYLQLKKTDTNSIITLIQSVKLNDTGALFSAAREQRDLLKCFPAAANTQIQLLVVSKSINCYLGLFDVVLYSYPAYTNNFYLFVLCCLLPITSISNMINTQPVIDVTESKRRSFM